MKELITIVDECPMAMPRPRIANGRAYYKNAKDIDAHKKAIKDAVMETTRAEGIDSNVIYPKGTAVEITLIFFLPIPESTSKKKKMRMIFNSIKHTKKPDIDNLVKMVMDALTPKPRKGDELGAWADDSQVVSLKAKKLYSENPHILIMLREQEEVNEQNRIG